MQPYAEVTRRTTFEAAHRLPLHDGKCAKLHGHSYTVDLSVIGAINPATGMVCDFHVLDEFLQYNVHALYDHKDITEMFDGPATAEIIALTILTEAARIFYQKREITVTVFETADSWASVTWENEDA